MGTVVKKRESRRRLTAVNFLKNITLDGSKRQLEHQQNLFFKHQQSILEKSNLSNGHAITSKDEFINQKIVQETFRQPLAPIDTNDENKFNQQQTKASPNSESVKVYVNRNGYQNRTGSFSNKNILIEQSNNLQSINGTTGKIANGSIVSHSNGKVPSFSNTAKQTQSKVRFIKTLKGEKIKGEPIIFSSSKKSPLSIFSSIPFNKQQQFVFNFRDSLKEHGRRRHTSSSRQLSTILDGPEPLNLFEVMGFEKPIEGRDVSFQHLLNGGTNAKSNFVTTNNNSTTFVNQNQYNGINRTGSNVTNKRKPLITQHSTIDYSSTNMDYPISSCQNKQTNVLNNILNNSISNQHPLTHQSFHHSIHAHQPHQNNGHAVASRCLSLEQQKSNQQHSDCFIELNLAEQINNEMICKTKMQFTYDANLLDDPELIAGKHSTLLVFPSFVTSIIDYVKPSDLKKELNEKFKERFPSIQLSLSKLRSIKKEMSKIAKNECNLDYLTVAQAYVYFEKLILKLLINKDNRKLCAGACLVLSAKLNDVKGETLKVFIERIENGFRLNRKDLMATEFAVLVALEFSLNLPIVEVLPHYQRLIYEN